MYPERDPISLTTCTSFLARGRGVNCWKFRFFVEGVMPIDLSCSWHAATRDGANFVSVVTGQEGAYGGGVGNDLNVIGLVTSPLIVLSSMV